MYVAHERRAYILRLLEQRGHLRSAELAMELGVTDETIRTDLVALQRKGLLQRVHGGARYILPTGDSESTGQRLDCLMADVLASKLHAGMCLYPDDSPFSLVLAWRLRDTPCRFVSPSPTLLTRLGAKAMEHRLFLPCGELDKASGLITPDAAATDYLRAMQPEVAILRPDAVLPGHIAYRDATRAAWAQAAISTAGQCFVAAPASHLMAEAPHAIPCQPDLLLTEDNVPDELATHPALQTLPYISLENLLPQDRFDY